MAAQSSQPADQARVEAEVQAFAADPSHPRFTQLRLQMSELMRSGRARTLREAYDLALVASPDVAAEAVAGPVPVQ